MSEKTLKFDNIIVNKKKFHKSKQPIDLELVNVDLLNLNIMMMVLNILLVTKMVKSLNRYYYLTSNEWIHKTL